MPGSEVIGKEEQEAVNEVFEKAVSFNPAWEENLKKLIEQ